MWVCKPLVNSQFPSTLSKTIWMEPAQPTQDERRIINNKHGTKRLNKFLIIEKLINKILNLFKIFIQITILKYFQSSSY